MHHFGPEPAQQRSYLYPMIWALYLIGFILIAHCFDTTRTGISLPSVQVSHLAAVFGLGSTPAPECGSCQASPSPSPWANLHLAPTSDTCSNLSINPDLQAGCGFSLDASPTTSPAPSVDLSASAPDELPAPTASFDSRTSARIATQVDSNPAIN